MVCNPGGAARTFGIELITMEAVAISPGTPPGIFSVNFGLPSNIVRGSGFGVISKTAGPSRQIQFSLKFIY